jgi:HAD superfamily hydrolase (TIGR01509 family)
MNPSVIFDMDGVILDTERMFLSCWQQVAERHNIKDIERVIYNCIGTNEHRTEQIVVDFLGGSFDYSALRQEVSALFHLRAETDGIPLKPGVFELLDYLRQNNIKIGLASSTHIDKVTLQLRDAGVYDYFSVLVGGNMVSRSKPEPDIFLYCARLLGVEPENAFVIEDSFNGIRAAKRAGMHPIMVPDLVEPNDEMVSVSCSIQPDLLSVRNFFKETFN